MTTMMQKIQAIIDDAHASGMALSVADHDAEIDSRLDALAVEFMARRPDLEPTSLDDWLVNHDDSLTLSEIYDGNEILAAYS